MTCKLALIGPSSSLLAVFAASLAGARVSPAHELQHFIESLTRCGSSGTAIETLRKSMLPSTRAENRAKGGKRERGPDERKVRGELVRAV